MLELTLYFSNETDLNTAKSSEGVWSQVEGPQSKASRAP